jgi:hypothetical protein
MSKPTSESPSPANVHQSTPLAPPFTPAGLTPTGLPIVPPEELLTHFDITNHNIYSNAMRMHEHIDSAKTDTIAEIRKDHRSSVEKLNHQFSKLQDSVDKHTKQIEGMGRQVEGISGQIGEMKTELAKQIGEIAETIQGQFVQRLDQALYHNGQLAEILVNRVARLEQVVGLAGGSGSQVNSGGYGSGNGYGKYTNANGNGHGHVNGRQWWRVEEMSVKGGDGGGLFRSVSSMFWLVFLSCLLWFGVRVCC